MKEEKLNQPIHPRVNKCLVRPVSALLCTVTRARMAAAVSETDAVVQPGPEQITAKHKNPVVFTASALQVLRALLSYFMASWSERTRAGVCEYSVECSFFVHVQRN